MNPSMHDTQEEVYRASATQLRQLLRMAQPRSGEWQASELQSILAHQLDTPLQADLQSPGEASPTSTGPRTFGDLLSSLHPSESLLRRVKDFAKTHYQNPQSALPPDVGRVIYYGSLVAARLHARVSISSLGDKDLLAGSRWALQQPWLDLRCRTLFAEFLRVTGGSCEFQA